MRIQNVQTRNNSAGKEIIINSACVSAERIAFSITNNFFQAVGSVIEFALI